MLIAFSQEVRGSSFPYPLIESKKVNLGLIRGSLNTILIGHGKKV